MDNEVIISEEKPKNGKRNFILVSIFVLIALCIGLFVGYKKVIDVDGATILKNSIEDGYKGVSKVLEKNKNESLNFDILNEAFTVNLTGKINSNVEEIEMLNDLTLDLGVGLNYKNKEAVVKATVKNDVKNVDLDMVFLNNKGYLKSDEIFDKVLILGEYDLFKEMDLSSLNSGNLVNLDDLDYLVKRFKDIVLANILKKDVVTTKEDFTIEGKEYSGKKIVWHLDEEFVNRFIDTVASDQELLNILTKLTEKDANDIKEYLNEKKNTEVNQDLVFYANSFGKILAGSIKSEEVTFSFTNLNDEIKGEIRDKDATLNFVLNGENFSFKYTEDNEEVMNLEKKNNDLSIKINADGNDIALELKNMKNSKKEASADIKLSVDANNDEEQINLVVTGSISIKVENLNIMNVSDAVLVDDLSEEEQMTLIENLMNVLKDFGLENL